MLIRRELNWIFTISSSSQPIMRESGRMDCRMDSEELYTMMVRCMKDASTVESLSVTKLCSFVMIAASFAATSNTIKQMAMDSFLLQSCSTKETG